MFITPAYAQAAGGGGGGDMLATFAPLILIFVIFYFLLIRPQQKRAKEHQNMVNNLRRGDQVVTGGGMLGKVTKGQGRRGDRGRDRREHPRQGLSLDHHRRTFKVRTRKRRLTGQGRCRAPKLIRGAFAHALFRAVEEGSDPWDLPSGNRLCDAERLVLRTPTARRVQTLRISRHERYQRSAAIRGRQGGRPSKRAYPG